MNPALLVLLAIYSVAIVASSLLGGWLPNFVRFTHTRIQVLISFVGGLMLGIAVFHLLPHAVHEMGLNKLNEIAWAMMIGMIVMFFMLRFFHFHQHEPVDFSGSPQESSSEISMACDHDHSHDHGSHSHHHDHSHVASLSWVGVLVGLGFHTLLDGVALASTMQVEAGHGLSNASGWSTFWGLGVFLAIVLHKPLDAMSITSLMRAQGESVAKSAMVNVLFSAMVPVGALLVLVFGSLGGTASQSVAGWGLAFSAGVFLCISLSDLLPEMEFHSHNQIRLSAALLTGIIAAWAIGFLEPAHLHDHKEEDSHSHHDHHH